MSEISELEAKIEKTRKNQENINSTLNEMKNSLISSFDERHNFEQTLDQAKAWIKGKETEVPCPSLLPLKSEAAGKICQRFKKLDSDLKSYTDSTILSLRRQADALEKECDEEDAEELEDIVSEIINDNRELQETLSGTLNCIMNMVEARRDFERQVDIAQKWISEAESEIKTDTRSLNTADVLAEHLTKLEKLEDEQDEASRRVTSIANMCVELLEYLTEADKFTLGEIVRDLQDRTEFVNSGLTDKIEQIRDAIFTQRQMTERMVQSTQTLTAIQKEVRALNRPVGRRVEDAQILLQSYQAVMKKVSEFRKSLEEMRKCPDVTMEDMRDMIKQQQELMTALEKQITRIRQLILVRQQYTSLTSEISAFINRYTTIINDIEKSDMTVNDKLKKFNAVIIRIQECEGQLTSAQDKGAIISEEGHVEDRNAVMEQLKVLRSGVATLKCDVGNKQQEHETTAESHKKIQTELNTTMEWLYEQESELKSRPLLTLEVESAEDEIETHMELSTDIHDQIEKVKGVIVKAKKETGIPYILQERISEANMIVSTYPLELESRLKYLNDAKMLRVDYEEFSTKIKDWVDTAKQRLENKKCGDFDDLSAELNDHNLFFSSERLIGESLQQLGQTSERIVPSLASEDQEELSADLQQLTKDLDEVTKKAKQHKQLMEKNIKEFTDYKASHGKCKTLIYSAGNNIPPDDTAQNIVALRSHLQRLDEERRRLYEQNSIIQDYTEKANALLMKASDSSNSSIGKDMVDINKTWKEALEKMDTRKSKVQQMIEYWQSFELSVRSLEAGLSNLEQIAKELESAVPSAKTREEIDEALEVSERGCIWSHSKYTN